MLRSGRTRSKKVGSSSRIKIQAAGSTDEADSDGTVAVAGVVMVSNRMRMKFLSALCSVC